MGGYYPPSTILLTCSFPNNTCFKLTNDNYKTLLPFQREICHPNDPPQRLCTKERGRFLSQSTLAYYIKQVLWKQVQTFYNILHFLFPCLLFFVSSAAFVADLNTSLTFSFVFAEHSM